MDTLIDFMPAGALPRREGMPERDPFRGVPGDAIAYSVVRDAGLEFPSGAGAPDGPREVLRTETYASMQSRVARLSEELLSRCATGPARARRPLVWACLVNAVTPAVLETLLAAHWTGTTLVLLSPRLSAEQLSEALRRWPPDALVVDEALGGRVHGIVDSGDIRIPLYVWITGEGARI